MFSSIQGLTLRVIIVHIKIAMVAGAKVQKKSVLGFYACPFIFALWL